MDTLDKLILPFLPSNTKRLVKRRGGIRNHLHLKGVYKEIGQDKYVKMTREKYKEQK